MGWGEANKLSYKELEAARDKYREVCSRLVQLNYQHIIDPSYLASASYMGADWLEKNTKELIRSALLEKVETFITFTTEKNSIGDIVRGELVVLRHE